MSGGYFPSHELLRNDNEDKYRSLAVLYNTFCFKCDDTENYNGVMYVQFSSVLVPTFKLLLVYRKNNSNIQGFITLITYLATVKDVDIILGDFNDNFSTDGILSRAICNLDFTQLVSEPTHLRGALLDQVYMKNNCNLCILEAIDKSVYFSDHEAIFLNQV